MTEKPCSSCGEVRPLEDFHRDRGRPDGRAVVCAECGRARSRRYYANHREERQGYARNYWRDNPGKVREHEANRPAESKWRRRYREACKKAGVQPVIVEFTEADFIERWGTACLDCGSPDYQVRHAIPVAAGGVHSVENVHPRCHPCANVKLNQLDKKVIRLYRTGTHRDRNKP